MKRRKNGAAKSVIYHENQGEWGNPWQMMTYLSQFITTAMLITLNGSIKSQFEF